MTTAAVDLETRRVCPSCGKDRPAESFGGAHPDECFRCHALSLEVAAGATPSRSPEVLKPGVTAKIRERLKNSNAWERGVKVARTNRDGTQMPYLNEKGQVVGVKEWADNRSKYEQAAERARQPGSLTGATR